MICPSCHQDRQESAQIRPDLGGIVHFCGNSSCGVALHDHPRNSANELALQVHPASAPNAQRAATPMRPAAVAAAPTGSEPLSSESILALTATRLAYVRGEIQRLRSFEAEERVLQVAVAALTPNTAQAGESN